VCNDSVSIRTLLSKQLHTGERIERQRERIERERERDRERERIERERERIERDTHRVRFSIPGSLRQRRFLFSHSL